jgi:F0F1-type ATP synthase assembly protein I
LHSPDTQYAFVPDSDRTQADELMPDDQSSNGPNIPIGYFVAGSEMVSFTVVGLLIDYALGTLPGFTIGLTLLGVVAAFWHLVQMSKALAAKRPKQPPSEGPAS